MDRRTFLKTTTVAAGSSLALSVTAAQATTGLGTSEMPAPAIIQGITEFSFATPWGPEVPVLGDAAARLRMRLQQALGTDYQVRSAGVFTEPAAFTFASIDVDSDPGLAFFAGLPGSQGIAPAHLQAWLAIGGGQMLWDDLAAQHGTKPLLAGHTGENPGLWASFQIADLPDLANRSVMLSGLGRPLARALGAEPADLAPSQLSAALVSGHLAAAEWGNPLAGLMLGLPDVATHFYRKGIHSCGTTFALNIQLNVWERLSPAQRIAIEAIAAQELSLSLAEAVAHRHLAERAIARGPKITVAETPPAVVATVENAAAAVLDRIASHSLEAARIRDSYLAFQRLLPEPNLAHSV